jgi:hypothetical protein
MFINYRATNCHSLPYVTYKPVRLKNKRTKKVRTEMRVDTRQSPQEVFWLRPGWNEFPKHIWEQNKDAPSIKQMLKKGTIQLLSHPVEKKVRDKKTGKKKVIKLVLGQDDAEMTLRYFDEKQAIAIVKETWNRDILQRWLDEEMRHRVKRALTKQVEPLINNSKDDDDDSDDE